MGVVEFCPAPEASGIEEGIQAEGGILKAHIVLKKRSAKEGRLAKGAAGEAGRAEAGIAEVGLAGKDGFLHADIAKGCAPEGGVLVEADPGEGGIGNGAVDQSQGFLDLGPGQRGDVQVARDEDAVVVNWLMGCGFGQDLLGGDGGLGAGSGH